VRGHGRRFAPDPQDPVGVQATQFAPPRGQDNQAKAAAALVKGLLETFPTKDTDEQLRAFPFTGEDVHAPGKPEHLLRQHELPPAESNQGDTLAARVRAHLSRLATAQVP